MNSHNELLRDALHAERNARSYQRWLAKGGPSRRQAEYEHEKVRRLIEGLERRQQAARQTA